jgi:signal transduction histidine kinase
MHMLPVLGFVSLLAACVVLIWALFRARKTARELGQQLSLAREQQYRDKMQLSVRSQLDTLKDEFISTVSHELRTPLTSIRGALGLLASGTIGELDPRAMNLLRIATTNTDRLIRLINDILDLERMESGRAPLQIRRCSLRDLCDQAIETMTPMAEDHAVHLELVPFSEGQTPDSLFFDGDSDRILQVLTNLLSNAIKFSPAASTVRIHTDATSDSLLLKVVDEGRGIPADKLDSIFDRFQQVEHADARQRGGTGLGLSICRSIVQQHSGAIWAQRNLIKGTTMFVMLPRTALLLFHQSKALFLSATMMRTSAQSSPVTLLAKAIRSSRPPAVKKLSISHRSSPLKRSCWISTCRVSVDGRRCSGCAIIPTR